MFCVNSGENFMKKYTKEHEWVEIEGLEAVVGITEHAAKQLGDITYVELPKKSKDLITGDVLGVVESVKAASDIYSPISGTVSEVNTDLEDDPSIINKSAEKNGWICKLENVDLDEVEELVSQKELLTKEEYDKFVKSTSK